MTSNRAKLSDIIGPAFYDLHKYVKTNAYTHYWLKGGRGSLKSSFIGTEIPLGIMRDAKRGVMSNAVVIRRVKDTLRGSVYEQIKWGIFMLKAEEELSDIVGDKMSVFRSAPFFLELVPNGIDKAQSLQRLLGKINLTPADMIAFGDGYNDLSMLKLAGVGVAMANAAPEVRAEADYVTLSNEEDGVAAALNHFWK